MHSAASDIRSCGQVFPWATRWRKCKRLLQLVLFGFNTTPGVGKPTGPEGTEPWYFLCVNKPTEQRRVSAWLTDAVPLLDLSGITTTLKSFLLYLPILHFCLFYNVSQYGNFCIMVNKNCVCLIKGVIAEIATRGLQQILMEQPGMACVPRHDG